MNPDTNALTLTLNSIVTVTLGIYVIYLISEGKSEKHLFYYLFGIGFIIYGIQIFYRVLYADIFSASLLYCGAILLVSVGLWSLSRKKLFSVLFSVYVFIFSLMAFWKLNMLPSLLIEWGSLIGSFTIHAILMILILYHRFYFGKAADKFMFGWALLFLTNMITFGMGWITDIFAIFAKVILFFGVNDYDFIILTKKIRDEITAKHLPTDTSFEKKGGLKLILYSQSSSASYIKQVSYIERLATENARRDASTFVFTFQDAIPYHELQRIKWINPEKVFVFLFSASAEKAKNEFTLLRMGLTHIGAALSEIIKASENSNNSSTVIFSNLSILIHMFEPYPIYNMLLNKMGALREKGVELVAFINLDTHVDKSIISLFADIADEVVKL